MGKESFFEKALTRRDFISYGVKGGVVLAATPSIVSGLLTFPGQKSLAERTAQGLDEAEIKKLLMVALANGGDFAEVYVEHRKNTSIRFEEARVRSANFGISQGVGIRVVSGNKVGYAYSDDLAFAKLSEAAKTASYIARGGGAGVKVAPFKEKEFPSYITVKLPLEQVADDKRFEVVARADKAARGYDPRIIQVYIDYYDEIRERTIANSNGLMVTNELPLIWFVVQTLSSHNGKKHMGRKRVSEHTGFEFFDKYSVEEIAREAAREAIAMLEAGEAPAGEMPVVIANGWGGVLVHEAVGHGLEGDGIYWKTSIYAGKVGEKVASPLATLIDDGTLRNYRGTTDFDDEGTPGERTVLIENGVLKGYMHDLISAKMLKMKPTGSGRRTSFRHYPIPRMRNTFLANGGHHPEEIVKATKNGLFVKALSGGSVNPATGQFNFDVREAYIIENGKIAYPVRGATLIGRGFDVLGNVDMVANDLAFAPGICGKSGQWVEVTAGQPTVRVAKSIKVGGSRRR
jgi:TldD protein